MALVMLLQTTLVDDVCPRERRPVTVRSGDSLMDAYARILEANVLSAPVYDQESEK